MKDTGGTNPGSTNEDPFPSTGGPAKVADLGKISRSAKATAAVSEDKNARKEQKDQYSRKEELLDASHQALLRHVPFIVSAVLIIIAGLALARVSCLVLPKTCCWMEKDQIESLDWFCTSAVKGVGVLVLGAVYGRTSGASKRVELEPPSDDDY